MCADKRTLEPNERLQFIGLSALRGPDGKPLKAEPMYVIITEGDINPKTGFTETEEKVMDDFAKVFAPKFKEYVDGIKAAGLSL